MTESTDASNNAKKHVVKAAEPTVGAVMWVRWEGSPKLSKTFWTIVQDVLDNVQNVLDIVQYILDNRSERLPVFTYIINDHYMS